MMVNVQVKRQTPSSTAEDSDLRLLRHDADGDITGIAFFDSLRAGEVRIAFILAPNHPWSITRNGQEIASGPGNGSIDPSLRALRNLRPSAPFAGAASDKGTKGDQFNAYGRCG